MSAKRDNEREVQECARLSLLFFGRARSRASGSLNAQAPVVQARSNLVPGLTNDLLIEKKYICGLDSLFAKDRPKYYKASHPKINLFSCA